MLPGVPGIFGPVLAALEQGAISPSRHESYCALYEDAMQIRDWERKEGDKRS